MDSGFRRNDKRVEMKNAFVTLRKKCPCNKKQGHFALRIN